MSVVCVLPTLLSVRLECRSTSAARPADRRRRGARHDRADRGPPGVPPLRGLRERERASREAREYDGPALLEPAKRVVVFRVGTCLMLRPEASDQDARSNGKMRAACRHVAEILLELREDGAPRVSLTEELDDAAEK